MTITTTPAPRLRTRRLLIVALLLAALALPAQQAQAAGTATLPGGTSTGITVEVACYQPNGVIAGQIKISGPSGQYVASRLWIYDLDGRRWYSGGWKLSSLSLVNDGVVQYSTTLHNHRLGFSGRTLVYAQVARWTGSTWTLEGSYPDPDGAGRPFRQYTDGTYAGGSFTCAT